MFKLRERQFPNCKYLLFLCFLELRRSFNPIIILRGERSTDSLNFFLYHKNYGFQRVAESGNGSLFLYSWLVGKYEFGLLGHTPLLLSLSLFLVYILVYLDGWLVM